MAPAVLRNGMVKGHLMFYAPAILSLQDESSETFHEALYLVAHECAHIEDLTHRDECFPGVIIQREMSVYESLVEPVAGRFWEEYAACRVSAVFDESRTSLYEDGLIKVLQVAHDGANDAIRSYRLHGDLDRVLQEAGCPLCEPLRLAAYLMGHIDGLDEGFDSVPQAREWISKSSYSRLVDRLRARLRQLWSRRGHWTSIAEFEPLRDIVRDVLADGGINLTRLSDGTVRVDIPFSRETMPS